jgi:23S rRNA (pseudouridine1915-N3)-methyltransferase
MKLLFLSVGKKHEPALAEMINEFTDRVNRYAPTEWKLIPSGQSVETEGTAILGGLNERDFIVVLDEHGSELDSNSFSQLLEKRLNASTHRLVFVIGGAYGVSAAVSARANSIVSLSKLTFPHQLVRLILAEQVYRGFSILKGEKYHHAS